MISDKELLYRVKGICMKVHSRLGCGLLENAYRLALVYLLKKEGFGVKTEVAIPIIFDDLEIPNAFRADLIIEERLIVELKVVDEIHPVHHLQLSSYMQLSGLPLGLLVNFHTNDLLRNMFTTRLVDLKNKYKNG